MKSTWRKAHVLFLGLCFLHSSLGASVRSNRSNDNQLESHPAIKDRRRCVFLNDNEQQLPTTGGAPGGHPVNESNDGAMTEILCAKESNFCYALWHYVNGTPEFTMQGCWEASSNNTCMSSQCVQRLPKSAKVTTTVAPPQEETKEHPNMQQQHHFCCCDSDTCNMDVEVLYVDTPKGDPEKEVGLDGQSSGRRSLPVILILCGSLMFGILIILGGIRYWKRMSRQYDKNGAPNPGGEEDELSLGVNEGKILLLGGEDQGGDDRNIIDGIQLVVLLARGKFASVYEGKIPSLSDAPYALKCFTREQKEFFENERFVFNYLGKHCNHENIIKYHGWQEFTVGPTTHLILVLDKVCPGNLREYLQSVTSDDSSENENILKISDVLKICSGIASGLSYLHGENRDEIVIAHRDLTSKNILLDGDTLTPKITDYGLSLVTKGSKYYWAGRERQAEFCSLAEAGTLRYMAPELLEGAVNLKDCENALKQADVYALALIIWEVAHCSKDVRLTKPPRQEGAPETHEETGNSNNSTFGSIQHCLPYEEEIGKDNLSMDLLTRHVVQYRSRPNFRRWRDSAHTRQLRDTLVESWDAEPDARLTALCIVERLIDIRNIRVKNSDLGSGSGSTTTAAQSPLESPGQGLFGSDSAVIDSPWTGRNPCLQRNLLTVTATSAGMGGMSTSGSGMSESNSSEHHHLLLNYDYKNQANLNFYHNYVGGSSGGVSYTSSSTTSAPGGNTTEMSNVSSITDEHHPVIETRFNGGAGAGAGVQGPNPPSGPPPLPPTIPFVQNLHA